MAYKWRWPLTKTKSSAGTSSAGTSSGGSFLGGDVHQWALWYAGMMLSGLKVRVSEESAICQGTILASLALHSNTIAMLPKHIMRRTEKGNRRETGHEAYNVVKKRANHLMTSFHFWKKMTNHVYKHGEAWAYIDRHPKTAQIRGYIPWFKRDLRPYFINDMLYIEHRPSSTKVPYDDVLHFVDEHEEGVNIRGRSRAMICQDLIGEALSLGKYGRKFYEEGTMIDGYLKTMEELGAEQSQQLSESWDELYRGLDKKRRTPVAHSGSDYKPLHMNMNDAQKDETVKSLQIQIASVMGAPPSLIGILDNANYSNMVEQNIQYATYSVAPFVEMMVQEHDCKVLTDDFEDQSDLFTYFDLKGLLKGNPTQRADLYKFFIEYGILEDNDILAMEDMNPKDFSKRTMQMNRIDKEMLIEYTEAVIAGKVKMSNTNNSSNVQGEQ